MRIGRFSLPAIRLYPALIDAVRTIHDRYGAQRIEDLDELARLLGHASSRSGTFMLKLAALRSFGLLEGRGSVKVTAVGAKIARGATREEEAEALESALGSIPLWGELRHRFGVELPADFPEHLATIVGDPEEARAKAEWVKKSYLTDAKPLRNFRLAATAEGKPTGPKPPSGAPEVVEIRLGNIYLSLPLNQTDIETARSLLDLVEKRLRGAR